MCVAEVFISSFQIMVNGKLFQTFQHRIPIHRVTNLLIKGNIGVNNIKYEDPRPQFQPQV